MDNEDPLPPKRRGMSPFGAKRQAAAQGHSAQNGRDLAAARRGIAREKPGPRKDAQ
jgi:hypothetical protein